MDNTQTGTEFYKNFFVNDRKWNSRYPNFDEATRLGTILPLVVKIAQAHYAAGDERFTIIRDVGGAWYIKCC